MRRKVARFLLLMYCLLVFPMPYSAKAVTTHLRVAFNMNQAPYHFVDEDGRAVGLHIDMLEYIGRNSDFEFDYFPFDSGTECINALHNGQVDVVLDISSKFGSNKWVSEPISEEIVCIVENNLSSSVEEDDDYFVSAVQLGAITPSISFFLNSDRSIIVPDASRAINYLASGEADQAVILKESAYYYLPDYSDTESYVIASNYIGVVNFAFKVPDNDYYLLHSLNRGISSLRASKEYGEMREQWSRQENDNSQTLTWLKQLVLGLMITLVIIASYAIVGTLIRRALRRQVEIKTAELHKANDEIERQMEQLKAESDIRNRIIRYSHLAMVLFDHQYRIHLINDSAIAMAGATDNPIDIRDLSVFGDLIRSYDENAVPGAIDRDEVQSIVLSTGTRERRFRYSFRQLTNSESGWSVLLMVEDITEEEARRCAKFEEEKSRTLNQVVAGIAHEIKNPLTSIKAFVAALKDEKENPYFMEDFICYVPSEVDRINRLVESLIGYAKPAKGVMGRIDLTNLVWDTVFFARNMNLSKQIDVICEVEEGHVITGSQDQIKQILINIIVNGMESMRDKLSCSSSGERLSLNICLKDLGGRSCVSVRDEGMGMSREAIERCMEPFFTTKRAGTGLGLTLSKQYVRENNGELHISSEVGQYTEIEIIFGRELHESEDSDC